MADPFEVRMRFTSQLQHLNASVNSAQKAAYYALKFKDMHEDLHSCILEQLERNSMNTRANIMYFIEHLCDMAQRENETDYVRMMQRDIFRVVDAVAPNDGSGAANVKVVRRVLNGLQRKSVLQADTVTELEAALKERDVAPGQAGLSPSDGSAQRESTGPTGATGTPKGDGVGRLDRRQIEQRIEEDRERHKRLKETIWGISGEGDVEFQKMLDECSDLGEDDRLQIEEDVNERKRAMAS